MFSFTFGIAAVGIHTMLNSDRVITANLNCDVLHDSLQANKYTVFAYEFPLSCNKMAAYTLKNKRVNQHLKGPRSDSVFKVLHLPYYPAGANSLKC